jgi:hypothetical protein
MGRRGRRATVSATLLAVAVGFGIAPAAAARNAPHARMAPAAVSTPLSGAVPVSPVDVDSTADEPIALVAGSASYLVFSRSTGAAGVNPDFQPTSMYVTNASGDVTSLGVQPAGFGWSIAGDLLTSTPSYFGTTVDWVDLTDGTAGSGSMPAGAAYLGATPSGWAYVKNNELFTETTSGISTSLGFPLGNGTGENVTSGGTGPDGALVVDATSAVAYVPYADPTHPVTLSTLDLTHGDPSTSPVYMQCIARTSDAFCGESPNTFPNSNVAGERLSLSGGPPTAVPPFGNFDFQYFAIDDQATAISASEGIAVSNPDGTNRVNDEAAGSFLVSAFDKVAVTGAGDTTIDTFQAPGDTPTVLVPPTKAPVEARSASITSGRVVYLDDQVSPTSKPAPYVWARPIRNVDGQIDVGTPDYVGVFPDSDNLSDDFRSTGPLLSSATLAVSLDDNTESPATAILRPLRPTTLEAGIERAISTLSGNRALSGSAARGIHDTTTGQFVRLAKHSLSSALWGQRFCFMSHRGAVACKDIDTRHTTRAQGPLVDPAKGASGGVSVYADHLSWLENGSTGLHALLVNLRHPHRRIALPAGMSVLSLTSNGVLLVKDDPAQLQTTYYLRGYGAHASPVELLAATGDESGLNGEIKVAVDQSVLTWDNGTDVMAAPLPHVADPPQYLGAPIAPRRLTRGNSSAWRAYLPYSASLDHCTVTIKRGHHTLRTLTCNPTFMNYGGAVVRWNGRDAHGKVAAGKVRWTAHVSNSDGDGLNGNGVKKPVTGTIMVKH